MFNIPLHPAIVHIPIALAMLMPLFIIVIWFSIHKKLLPAKSWGLIVGLQALLFFSSFLALETGEMEEEKVEKIIPESIIEHHEQMAKIFVGFSGGIAFIMLIGTFLPSRFKKTSRITSLILASGNLILCIWLGHSGGELVYRYDAASIYTNDNMINTNHFENFDDD